MIMKLNVSNELKSRLVHAAENGSVIAKDILSEVKKNVPVEEINIQSRFRDRKSTRLNSSHSAKSRMPSSA